MMQKEIYKAIKTIGTPKNKAKIATDKLCVAIDELINLGFQKEIEKIHASQKRINKLQNEIKKFIACHE